MSFPNAVRILQDMQDFLHNIRGHMESSHSSDSEQTEADFSSTAPSETTLMIKKPRRSSQHPSVELEQIDKLIGDNDEDTRSPTVDAVLAIVRCTVCLEVPRGHTYQCARGHLICEMCLCHLIKNARSIGETALCPTCRDVIRKETSWRNNAIEDVAAELPSECIHCFKEFKIKYLSLHEQKFCPMRIVNCKFKIFGCSWAGPQKEQDEHHLSCLCGKAPLFSIIDKINEAIEDEKAKRDTLTDLLCGIGVEQLDIELRPYVTLGDMKKILYDSPTFKALNTFWTVMAKIDHKSPESTDNDKFMYRLIWKTPRSGALNVRFVILRGPYNDMEIDLKVQSHRFTEEQSRTDYIEFPFINDLEYVRQISNSSIPFRFLMSWDQ